MAKISIIIPVYNVEQFLDKCVQSLLSQTFTDIEILLVNDGSTDNSTLIAQEFAQHDVRIKYFYKENSGVSDARNLGIINASSSYIIFLDADDWLDENTCQIAYDTINNNEADMVFWGFYKAFPNEVLPEKLLYNEVTVFNTNQLQFLQRRICGMLNEELINTTQTDLYSMPWGKIIKKECITSNQIKFIDRKIVGSEDTLFNFLLFQKLKKVIYINKHLNFYRQDNPNSLTKTDLPFLMPRFLNLFQEMTNYINDNNLGNNYQIALQNRIALSTIGINLFIVNKRNTCTFLQKLKQIRAVLYQPVYEKAYQNLSLTYLPIHWKVFFWLCKNQFVLGVFVLSQVMRKLRNNE